VGGEGKSGAFFYMTADKRYMIKSIRKAESRMLRNVLNDYHDTLKESIQYTLLPVYLGLYKLQRGLRKTFLIVMENLFRSPHALVERYDVKVGSRVRPVRVVVFTVHWVLSLELSNSLELSLSLEISRLCLLVLRLPRVRSRPLS
jgi:Phosphatidylinositol-4-phosphate 5-Kinase